MTDLTFAPMIINFFLVSMIAIDIIVGRWSIITTIELVALITWNGLLFYLDYRLGKSTPLTPVEAVNKYPKLWGWYFSSSWRGFWQLNEGQISTEYRSGGRTQNTGHDFEDHAHSEEDAST